jgi:tetratricopeptide (TPR) repeat protein
MSIFDRLRLPPRTQRRFERIGAGTLTVVGYPFRLLIGLGRATVGMVANWWESRNLRYLLRGLPALVAAIGIIVVGSMVFFQDRSALAQTYRETGDRATAEIIQKLRLGQDAKPALALAETCYKRLSLLPTKKDENDYHVGLTYLFQRNYDGAFAIFEQLASPCKVTDRTLTALRTAEAPESTVNKVAPLKDIPFEAEPLTAKLASVLDQDEFRRYAKLIIANSPNATYGPAHYQVALRLLQQPNPTPKDVVRAENHLLQAVHYKVGREAWLARISLFNIMRLTNRTDEAEQMLEEAVRTPVTGTTVVGDEYPEYRLMLANWYISVGKRDLAERQADLAIAALRKKVDESPNDHLPRGQLIDAASLAGWLQGMRGDYRKSKESYARAKDLCHTGRVLSTEPDVAHRYKVYLYSVLLSQYDATANEPDSFAERFHLLEQALALFPSWPHALMKLQVYLRKSGPERDKAVKYIDDSINQGGPQSAIGLMVKGNYAWEVDDVAGAKYYWEKAFEHGDYVPDVANNLAWVLVFNVKPPEFDRALGLVDAAMRKENKPQYHGTKGHILARMGRDREAHEELEQAKPAYLNDPKNGYELYVRLSEVCERLGMRLETERYRKLAEEIKTKHPAYFRQPASAVPAAPASPPTASPTATPNPGSAAPMNPAATPEKKDAAGAPAPPTPKP